MGLIEHKLYIELYRSMYLIRAFETRLLELFSLGKLFGTTHTYVGQEAIAVSVISNLLQSDIVFSNHRCHGHFLAKAEDPKGLLAEIMGRSGGVCGGRGGSQHLCGNNFYSNGIQGGYLSNAVGMAFAEKYNSSDNVVCAFIGDGTFGEGAVYEALNLASLWEVPLLIVVENNRYAQTTPIKINMAGKIVDRAKAFNISASEIESNDVSELYPRFKEIVERVRSSQRPYMEVVHTYRLNAHSKGDDFREQSEIDAWRKKDPLSYAENNLSKEEISLVQSEIESLLKSIESQVNDMPFAEFDT